MLKIAHIDDDTPAYKLRTIMTKKVIFLRSVTEFRKDCPQFCHCCPQFNHFPPLENGWKMSSLIFANADSVEFVGLAM